MLTYVDVCWRMKVYHLVNVLTYFPGNSETIPEVRLYTSTYVSIRQYTSTYVYLKRQEDVVSTFNICQHTSVYVSIRQHTSTYVNIRQHTSADECWRILTYADVCLGATWRNRPVAPYYAWYATPVYIDKYICWRMMTYVVCCDVCWRMLMYAQGHRVVHRILRSDVLGLSHRPHTPSTGMQTYSDVCADVCSGSDVVDRSHRPHTVPARILTYADVCWRKLTMLTCVPRSPLSLRPLRRCFTN